MESVSSDPGGDRAVQICSRFIWPSKRCFAYANKAQYKAVRETRSLTFRMFILPNAQWTGNSIASQLRVMVAVGPADRDLHTRP